MRIFLDCHYREIVLFASLVHRKECYLVIVIYLPSQHVFTIQLQNNVSKQLAEVLNPINTW